jgi:signal transduction histidine kinase
VLRTGLAIDTIELIHNADDTDHYYLISKFPMPDNHIGAIAVDITAQKMAEQKLTMLNEELNTFMYKASHDLKGPLSSIMGIAYLTRTEQFDPKALRYIEMIAESAQKLDKVLLGLIEVITVKQSQLKPEAIDFTQLIDEVMGLLGFMPGFDLVKFNVEVGVHKPFISDRNILISIVQNMVENAVKYRDSLKKTSFLDIRITDHLNGIQFEFKDNGVGIDKTVIDRIFDMFFRGNEGSKGSGLGLYIVKNAVAKLRGSINVESEKDKGCRFTIYLPGMTITKDSSS